MMQSKRNPRSQAKIQTERNEGVGFYDFYRLLSRGQIDGKHLVRYIEKKRRVWHIDSIGEWHLTPDVSRGAFTVNKALKQLKKMAPHYRLGMSRFDVSDPPEPEEWLEPRAVYGYPRRELYRLDLLQMPDQRQWEHKKSRHKKRKSLTSTSGPNQKNLIFSIAGALLLLALDGNQRLTEKFSDAESHSRWRKRIVNMIKQETGLNGDTNRIVAALSISVDNFLDSRAIPPAVSERNSKAETMKAWFAKLSALGAESKRKAKLR